MGFYFNSNGSDFSSEYLTVKIAAKISGYNQQYLRRLLRENVFRSRRIGQLWFFERDDFQIYLVNANQSNTSFLSRYSRYLHSAVRLSFYIKSDVNYDKPPSIFTGWFISE